MNQRGGVVNIVVVLIIAVFVLFVLMQPILLLTNNAEDQLATNAGITKYGTDADGNVVRVGAASSLGDLTMFLLFGIGFFIIIGIVIYIVGFGQEPPTILRREY
jgi:hypothetical protein